MKKDEHFQSMLKDNLLEDKVLKFLESNADITEVFPKTSKESNIVTT
jgi:hypothetical protein